MGSAVLFNAEPEHFYWEELRARALRTLIICVIVFIIAALGYQKIWVLFLLKIQEICPELKIVSRSVLGPATMTVSLAGAMSLIVGLLWGGGELWFFIKPALLRKERQLVSGLVLSFLSLAITLQYACFSLAFPYALSFFLLFNKNIVESSVDLTDLLFFALSLHKGMFFISLWPYVLIFLMMQGLISLEQLCQSRRHIYVGAFIFGMLLTPPDVVSQCILAIPLILLYEGALISIAFIRKF
jgi:sec-independent protein translocase protein TatC